MIDFETKKVLFIDLDGTLIKTISGKTFPEDITDFRIQLPVLDKIIEKIPNLFYFFIVTNQGGIEKRYVDEDEFIMGNHDNLNIMKSFETPFRCETVSWEEVIRVEKKTIILNHFPFGSLPDPATNRPIIQLHGHVHSTPDKPWNYFDNQYDVGVDNNNFTPVNLAELLDKIHYKAHIK